MKLKITSPADFQPNLSHKFFFDTNVWLYLIFPQFSNVGKRIIDQYSDFFNKVLQKDCLIETSVIQISELVNLIQRIEYREFCKNNSSKTEFKDYRKSADGIQSIKNAQTLISSLLKSSTIRSGNLTTDELLILAKNIEKADFNDMCFAIHCEKEDAILVTHDFDFNALNQQIQVISANSNYFS